MTPRTRIGRTRRTEEGLKKETSTLCCCSCPSSVLLQSFFSPTDPRTWSRARILVGCLVTCLMSSVSHAQQLDVRQVSPSSVRITLRPDTFKAPFPYTPALVDRKYPAPAISVRNPSSPVRRTIGALTVDVRPNPTTVVVLRANGDTVQRLVFAPDGSLAFRVDDAPVLGMGEGGPRPEPNAPWRQQPIQFDRRGRLDTMEPRWQSDAYGSRNPAAMLVGTGGWGLFVSTPWGQIDLRQPDHGTFLPWLPNARDSVAQNQRNQGQGLGKG